MAEEFVEIEQENDPLGILSKKPATSKVQGDAPVDNDPLGILKKKSTPVVSSVTPSPLPSQPDFTKQDYSTALKQGASLGNNSFLKEISKSVPKGTGKPDAPEGKWSNIVQNVFANLELAGTNLLADATTLVKDLSKNPYIPDVSAVMKEAEKSTGKSIPTPWQLDPLGNVIRGLHGNQERMQQVIANNPLPNTFWGKAVSSVASFAPDIAATALLPEAKLAQGASFLAKTGNLLFNNFTKYMMAKEGLAGYGEARKEGKNIGEAALEGVKGTGRGMATGMEMAILGAGSNLATKSIMTQAEKIGLTGVKGMAAKELVNLGTDVLAYGIVSPFAHAALEGRVATGEEIANGTGIAALLRLKGAAENIKSNTELNKAIKETLAVKQGVAISNFVDATPESIVEVYNSKGSADELQLRALEAAKKARQTTDLQKKAQYTAEAGVLGRAAGVKQVADMVINNRDGFAELKASNDLPESAKKEFLEKAEEINNLLNPLKKQEVDLDNKIKESEDLSSQFSQQAQEAQDPNQRAEFEAKAREAKDNADNFRNQLSEVKFNQNRPDVNAGKEPVAEGEVKIGDKVQWTSQGADQFTEPRKIKSISEDGQYAFVEGSDTGIPVKELSITEATPTEVKVTEEVIEKDDNGDFVPKKFTLNKAGENPAPNISIESIKEESFGGEMPADVKEVKLLEIRGRNAEGETVGSVSIKMNDGTSNVYEVKFNDEKLSPLEAKPTESKNVEQLRAEEQSELDSKIPNAEQYRVDGKVDRAKLTNEADIKAFDEVYNKYDKLISPLLKGQKQEVKPTETDIKEEYQKIKSNKKKKDFVRNNLPEEFKPLADELTDTQMSEIVDSNFDSKTIKNIQDAVQKQSAAEVLQPKQEGDGGTGGERKRVEQGKQGDESAGEGKAKTAEKAQPKGAEEGEVIGITHEQLNDVARELDFPEYEASPETIEQWDARAKAELAKGPEAANKLIAKYEKNILPDPWEQRMMLMIISSAKAKINANPSPENLAQFKRIMELSNNVGGKVVAQSLRARQGVKQVVDTLPDFLLMRENDRGYPFTESEIKDQARIFEELQKEKNALKEALQKSEEANAKLIAEMGVNKAKAAARKSAKKTKEEYVIERKQSLAAAREALKKLRSGEQGLTAVGIPGVKELTAVAPHIKNYMKSLVEEGVSKLDDVINDTYAEFKDIVDGITKKDILDAFNGEYDQSKPRTRNEKAEELRLLQREAALLKELENVRKGIEKEKNPAQKVKKNDRILELEDKIKEVKRLNKERDRVPQEFTEPEFASKTEGELLASKRRMLTKRIEKLQDDIKNKRYLEEKAAPPKLELDRKTQLLKDRVVKMERQIEAERQKDAYKKMSKTEKALEHINQITGIRRVMQTAFDLSVSLRQGIMIALNPRKWDVFAKAFGNQMKSVFSDKKFNSLMYDIHNSSEYNKMVADGIKFNELDALKNEERNEDFQKSFLYGIKTPIVRQLITEPLLASQRAADGFLNTARYEMYLKYEKQLLKQGITRQSDPEAYKRMADLVMNMTGRGKLISFLESGKANKVVSNTFYGARLMAANINSLNPVKYAKLPPGVRKDVMKDVLSIVTTTTGIMLAASAAGATVTLDPDEPDFLQIRVGDKVYDITGGKAAYLRTFFRMVSALYSRFTDNKYNQQKKIERAGSSLFKFFRNKLAPNTGYVVNMALGKNTLNQDFDPYEVLEAYPMYADDFAEALKDEGITSLATVLAPNILGIGYGSYATQANKESLETSLERMLNSDEMNPELIKNHKDGDRLINDKEFEELSKLRDANIEKEIRKLYDGKSKFNLTLDKGNVVTKKVEDMTEEEVKKAKKSIASEATRLSKEQLFGKERKTREEKIEDKKLSRARKRFDR